MKEPAPTRHQPDLTDRAFRIGLILKALNGIVETAGGIVLLIIKPEQISRWATGLTRAELSRDPHDFIANHILKTAHDLNSGSLLFGAIYLLSHGVVKLVLVIEVMRDRLWAYGALIVTLALFIVYQLYRIIERFSWWMTLLTILDAILIYLTAVEYKRHKAWHESQSHKKT